MASLPPYKVDFLKSSIEGGVLKFGTFELKSKRISPYFFNAGLFYTGSLIQSIANAFAHTIIDAADLEFDVIFGPAYKGIPLAVQTVARLSVLDPKKYSSLCYTFDRKEVKDHGEGGSFVGAPLKGKKVLIVDDVVTDGAAKREAIEKIRKAGGIVVGIVVAVDRMERLSEASGLSGIGALRKEYGLPILAILTLDEIIDGMKGLGLSVSEDDIKKVEEYRAKYKADS